MEQVPFSIFHPIVINIPRALFSDAAKQVQRQKHFILQFRHGKIGTPTFSSPNARFVDLPV
jgi:hypothetical protein